MIGRLILRGGLIAGSLALILYGLYDANRRRKRPKSDDAGVALAFELVEGVSLEEALSRGPLGTDQARRMLGDVCQALAAAHARRQAHGDLRPASVRWGPDGTAKVAPSPQAGPDATPAADLEALAVLAYEMLTARKPDSDDEDEAFVPVTRLRPELPAALNDFFAAALSDDAAKRPTDAAAFRAAFEECWS
jgi:serine/threonine-protein kinase